MGIYKEFIVRNARIWDGSRYLSGDVAVRSGKIVSLGGSADVCGEVIIDACGKLLTPGLVDIHTHLKNVSCEAFGTDASLCTLPFGVTAAVDGGACSGVSEYLDTLSVDTAVFVDVPIKNNVPCLDNLDERIKRYKNHFAGLKVYFDTSSPNVKSADVLKAVCSYAEKHGYRVMVHSANSPTSMLEIVEMLKKGDILTHAYHGGVNSADRDGFAAIFAAKEKGVIVDAGMAGYVHTDFKVLSDAIAAGALPDTVSTDITKLSAYIRGGRYGLTACMSIFRHLGMEESDILKSVTSDAAKAVGRDGWGKLYAGGDATFALFDFERGSGFSLTDRAGNHIESSMGYRCAMTVIKGEIMYSI